MPNVYPHLLLIASISIITGCTVYESNGKKSCDLNCLNLIKAANTTSSYLYESPLKISQCHSISWPPHETALDNTYREATDKIEIFELSSDKLNNNSAPIIIHYVDESDWAVQCEVI